MKKVDIKITGILSGLDKAGLKYTYTGYNNADDVSELILFIGNQSDKIYMVFRNATIKTSNNLIQKTLGIFETLTISPKST